VIGNGSHTVREIFISFCLDPWWRLLQLRFALKMRQTGLSDKHVWRDCDYYHYWGETESTWYCGHYWPTVPTSDTIWLWFWSNWWNEDWQRKPKHSEKTCPSATLSTTKSHKTWPGREPGPPQWEASY
jgi:hypothetical protein